MTTTARPPRRPAPKGGRAVAGLGIGAVALTGLGVAAHRILNDTRLERRPGLVTGRGDRILVVCAHPDDEIFMAGALALAARAGARVDLVCLTRGENSVAAVVDGLVGSEQIGPARLGAVREAELVDSCRELGVREPIVLGHPDGALDSGDDDRSALRADLTRVVAEVDPTVIVSMDDVVGLYGHPDHVASGRLVRELIADPLRRPAALRVWYQATLPARLVALVRRASPVFAAAIVEAGSTPPPPTFSVPVSSVGAAKRHAVAAHRSQRAVLSDVQPGWRFVPGPIYYRILDREYYAEVPVLG